MISLKTKREVQLCFDLSKEGIRRSNQKKSIHLSVEDMDADTKHSEARPSSCRQCELSQSSQEANDYELKLGSMHRTRGDVQITHNQGTWLKQSEYNSMLEKGFIQKLRDRKN